MKGAAMLISSDDLTNMVPWNRMSRDWEWMEHDGTCWKMLENDGKWWKMMEHDGWMMENDGKWWMNDGWMMDEWWMNDGWMMDEWWMNRMMDGTWWTHAELWSQFQRRQRIVLSQEQSLRNQIEECLSCTTNLFAKIIHFTRFTKCQFRIGDSPSEAITLTLIPRMRRNASHLIHQRAAQIEEHMFHWPGEDSPASKRSKHQASLNCVAPVLASALRLVPFGFPVVVLVPATGSLTDSDWQHRCSCLRSIFERESCATCRHERFWRIATWQQIGLGHNDWLATQTQTGKLPDDEVREQAGYPRTATKHKMFNNSPALALEPTFVTNYAGFI